MSEAGSSSSGSAKIADIEMRLRWKQYCSDCRDDVVFLLVSVQALTAERNALAAQMETLANTLEDIRDKCGDPIIERIANRALAAVSLPSSAPQGTEADQRAAFEAGWNAHWVDRDGTGTCGEYSFDTPPPASKAGSAASAFTAWRASKAQGTAAASLKERLAPWKCLLSADAWEGLIVEVDALLASTERTEADPQAGQKEA